MKVSQSLAVALTGFVSLAAAYPQVQAANASAAATNSSSSSSDVTGGKEYDYIVIGSGAGGGPLASRLAMAGESVLLIDSGDDQGTNPNVTIPGFQGVVAEDPQIRWDMFVNHYQDQERAKRDPKFVYEIGPYEYHVGPNPPPGATPLGINYPRAGTLGGCTAHNALIWITPHNSDWDKIAQTTGDDTWSSSNMNKYLTKVYEWLKTEPTDPTILLHDLQLTQQLAAGAAVMGKGPLQIAAVTGLLQTLTTDPNYGPGRDSAEGFYQIPLIMNGGQRNAVRDFVVATKDAGHPLTLGLNRYVTKINFDQSGSKPKAVSVDYLEGKHLYSASPLSGGPTTKGRATAKKEIIVAAGTYNTVQLLTLSGIGQADQLQKFGIQKVAEAPGLGTNMQDRYEVPVNVEHTKDFPILNGCTFDGKEHDECYRQWNDNINVLAARGPYATNGLAAAMAVNSEYADDKNIDLFIFGGPVDFRGYYPNWGAGAIVNHNRFSWYSLKAHSRNKAGTVQLRDTNPFSQPIINFNYFDEGTTTDGADQKDLLALVQAVNMSREALSKYKDYAILLGSDFEETNPGPDVQTDEEIADWAKSVAWGHHACCTAKIGTEEDSSAVIDSKFRVKGVDNLRIVDASVFPDIPGVFIQAPIYMVSEKAADDILNGS